MKEEQAKTVISAKDLMDDLYLMIQESKDPDLKVDGKPYLMRLNKRSIKKIYGMMDEILSYYTYEADFGEMVEIRPFRGVVIQAENQPATETVNNLTGQSFIQSKRRKIRAYICRYWRRKTSNLGT